MTPVALGRDGGESFLVTEAVEGCVKLSDWVRDLRDDPQALATAERVFARVGRTARTMHAAGLHHQDFYLYHLLVPSSDVLGQIVVIDLGRAQSRRRLGSRWIVKDLAQLNYSARELPSSVRQEFFTAYFDEPRRARDTLMRRVEAKTRAIARHSRKHAL